VGPVAPPDGAVVVVVRGVLAVRTVLEAAGCDAVGGSPPTDTVLVPEPQPASTIAGSAQAPRSWRGRIR
jgi:hypothetical protein